MSSIQFGKEILKKVMTEQSATILVEQMRASNKTPEWLLEKFNLSLYESTLPGSVPLDPNHPNEYINSMPSVKAFFYCLYILIFLVGIIGNALVCYVVIRNKTMQTVTNLFITNLALSDILLCAFAVPFTPLYLLTFRAWVFGKLFCHLLPYAQGVSVYISAFTLMSIAIDRFFVIIYPFKPRMEIKVCFIIIAFVWIAAGVLTFPYGWFMELYSNPTDDGEPAVYCEEHWPQETSRKAFGFTTSILQFVIPFTIISFCYVKVCLKLRDRARCKPGAKTARKEELERERTKRTNRMLISMVMIFGVSWLPLNLNNLVQDFYEAAANWTYSRAFFLLAHAAAMSSTCYNPFLYAWLNENFRKEFKQVLPCFRSASRSDHSSNRNKRGTNKQPNLYVKTDMNDPCNGNHETIQMQEQSVLIEGNNLANEPILEYPEEPPPSPPPSAQLQQQISSPSLVTVSQSGLNLNQPGTNNIPSSSARSDDSLSGQGSKPLASSYFKSSSADGAKSKMKPSIAEASL